MTSARGYVTSHKTLGMLRNSLVTRLLLVTWEVVSEKHDKVNKKGAKGRLGGCGVPLNGKNSILDHPYLFA